MSEQRREPTKHRPDRRFMFHLFVCLRHGHESGDWQPAVSRFSGEVVGASLYCRRCGSHVEYCSFMEHPEKSAVFADREWYPGQLSCYDEEPPGEFTCDRCGRSTEDRRYMSLNITDYDLNAAHQANRTYNEQDVFLCDGCADTLAEWVQIERVEPEEKVLV